jgi:hypothetical protein
MLDGLGILGDQYFHQDWDLDYSSPQECVADFKRYERDVVCRTIADLDAILASSMSEKELERLWTNQLSASYMPTSDGLTYRQWFAQVRRFLAE